MKYFSVLRVALYATQIVSFVRWNWENGNNDHENDDSNRIIFMSLTMSSQNKEESW